MSEDECQLVQRFDPTRLYNAETDQTDTYNLDTIGFFIAKFVKKCLQKSKWKTFQNYVNFFVWKEKSYPFRVPALLKESTALEYLFKTSSSFFQNFGMLMNTIAGEHQALPEEMLTKDQVLTV